MIDLLAMAYIVSVCLYLARQYPVFPKRETTGRTYHDALLSSFGPGRIYKTMVEWDIKRHVD